MTDARRRQLAQLRRLQDWLEDVRWRRGGRGARLLELAAVNGARAGAAWDALFERARIDPATMRAFGALWAMGPEAR